MLTVIASIAIPKSIIIEFAFITSAGGELGEQLELINKDEERNDADSDTLGKLILAKP